MIAARRLQAAVRRVVDGLASDWQQRLSTGTARAARIPASRSRHRGSSTLEQLENRLQFDFQAPVIAYTVYVPNSTDYNSGRTTATWSPIYSDPSSNYADALKKKGVDVSVIGSPGFVQGNNDSIYSVWEAALNVDGWRSDKLPGAGYGYQSTPDGLWAAGKGALPAGYTTTWDVDPAYSGAQTQGGAGTGYTFRLFGCVTCVNGIITAISPPTSGAPSTGQSGTSGTNYPVRFGDGGASLTNNDFEGLDLSDRSPLARMGIGNRSWNNQTTALTKGDLLQEGMTIDWMPHLESVGLAPGVDAIAAFWDANNIQVGFRLAPQTGDTAPVYQIASPATGQSLGTGSSNSLVWSNADKIQFVFNDFSTAYNVGDKGLLSQIIYPDGRTVSFGRSVSNQVTVTTSYTENGITISERVTKTGGAQQMTGLTYERKIGSGSYETLKSAAYTYDGRNLLQSVTVKDGPINTAPTVKSEYYRWYGSRTSEPNGYDKKLKFWLSTDSVARAKTELGVTDLSTVSDANLKPYADNYFEYDQYNRVTKEIAQGAGCGCGIGGGGQGQYTFTYADNPNLTGASGLNTWATRTKETLPDKTPTDLTDNDYNIVYTNSRGDAILTVFTDVSEGKSYATWTRYDDSGRVLMTAQPSAVSGWSESYADLVNFDVSTGRATGLYDSAGDVAVSTYYTAATAPDPKLVGYIQSVGVQRGDDVTTRVTTEALTYTDGGATGDGIFYVATDTVYGGATGTNAEVTSYTYDWYTSGGNNTTAMKSRTTTLAKITSSQNGPDSTSSSFASSEYYDSAGNLVWTKDADGYVDYYARDTSTGGLTSVTRDVNPSSISSPAATAPTRGSGLGTAIGLVDSTNVFDAKGRVTKSTSASGVITYTVYDDSAFDSDGFTQVKSYTWDAANNRPIGPVTVSRDNPSLGFKETLTYSWPTTAGSGWFASNAPTGIETLADVTIQSLTRTYYNVGHKATETREYFHLPSGAYSTATSYGTSGTDYLKTTYLYDGSGNVMRTARPDGTLEWSVYDGLNRLVSSWKGTNDAGYTPTDPTGGGATGNNMVKVASYVYDDDGNLLESRSWFGSGTSDYYRTRYQYDFRGRLVGKVGPDGVGEKYTLDNEGHQTKVETFANTTVNTDGTLNYGASSNLRGKTETFYDDQGRVYRTTTYKVDPTTGTVGASITTNTYYDRRGNVAKTSSANGLFQKSKYDGVGRVVSSYVSYDDAESSWADALTVTGDTVVSQQDVIYVADRAVISSSLDRTAATGSATGALSKSNARLSTSVSWYDAAGRVIASGSYGTDPDNRVFGSGGAIVDANSDGVPDIYAAGVPTSNSSSGQLFLILSKTAYDAAGRVLSTTDNKGHVTRYAYDLLGRKTAMIENYVDGVASETESDTDRTTQWLYDPWGRLVILRALNPQGSGNGVQWEDTQYFYGSDVDRSWLSFTIYPDSENDRDVDSSGNVNTSQDAIVDFDWDSTGKGFIDPNSANNFDYVGVTFDRLGRQVTSTDQRGVVHTYAYDTVKGYLSSDVVTSLGRTDQNVDGAVRAIGYGYDDGGRPQTTSTFSNTAMTSIASQVKLTYDGWGDVIKSQQSHSGAVTSGTPAVQYAYDDGAVSGVAKYVRLSKVTYPNAREVNYLYGGDAANNKLNRVYEIGGDTSDTDSSFDARYFYSGTGTILRELRASTTSKLDYDPAANGAMSGFDRFGRVVGQTWYKNTGTSSSPTWAAADATAYTYDENSNRTNRVSSTNGNGLADPYSYQQSYAYDGLDRLTSSADSKPNSGGTAWVGTNGQSWSGLDALGNWRSSGTDTDGDGIDDTTQTRTHNAANEITSVGGSPWGTPTYDAAGNLTRLPPASGSSDAYQIATYDAWNHQVMVIGYNASDVATRTTVNVFDGLGRRIKDNTGDVFFNEGWQAIETRDAGGTPTEQTVYSLRYVDAPLSRDVIGTSSTTRQWVQQDANFNVTSVADANGAVLERYRYTPYGERSVYLATGVVKSDPTTSAYSNGVGWQGGKGDSITGEVLFDRREYSAMLGRWVQRDPSGYSDSANLLQTERSNPVHHTDPSGLKTVSLTGTFNVFIPGDGPGLVSVMEYDVSFNYVCSSGKISITSPSVNDSNVKWRRDSGGIGLFVAGMSWEITLDASSTVSNFQRVKCAGGCLADQVDVAIKLDARYKKSFGIEIGILDASFPTPVQYQTTDISIGSKSISMTVSCCGEK